MIRISNSVKLVLTADLWCITVIKRHVVTLSSEICRHLSSNHAEVLPISRTCFPAGVDQHRGKHTRYRMLGFLYFHGRAKGQSPGASSYSRGSTESSGTFKRQQRLWYSWHSGSREPPSCGKTPCVLSFSFARTENTKYRSWQPVILRALLTINRQIQTDHKGA